MKLKIQYTVGTGLRAMPCLKLVKHYPNICKFDLKNIR